MSRQPAGLLRAPAGGPRIPAKLRVAASLVAALCILGAAGRGAAKGEPPVLRLQGLPGERAPAHEEDRPWAERVCGARDRVDAARRELADASARYSRMRRDDYPRGDDRELIKQFRLRARRHLERAERDFADLYERADWEIDVDYALESCPAAALPARPATADAVPASPAADADDGPAIRPEAEPGPSPESGGAASPGGS